MRLYTRTILITLAFSFFTFPYPPFILTLASYFYSSVPQRWRTFILGQWLWYELIIGKVRAIHKCMPGWGEHGPAQRRISGYLKGLALGREKGRPHRRFRGADCLSQLVSQSRVSLHWLCTLPRPHWRYSTGKGGEEAGFYTLSGLNNDVGAVSRSDSYSPWSFSSWPVASLVEAPVSADPCQRLPCTNEIAYHSSSLRPHTDNYNHTYSFFQLDWDAIMTNWRGDERCGSRRRSLGMEPKWRAGEDVEAQRDNWRHLWGLQYQCPLHRVSFFTLRIVHSPPCPRKSHILPCLAKEHFLSVWVLSLPSCLLQCCCWWWGWWVSCYIGCVKPFPLWLG